VAGRLAAQILGRGLPANTLLNINVPDLPLADLRGVRITRLGQRVYRDVLLVRTDPRGQPYYWVGGDRPVGVMEDGTDVAALAEGYVSVTPLALDMTAHHLIDELRGWELALGPANDTR
jgi:5'-nucleotidase